MFNIPRQYQVNRKIALKTIVAGDMKPAEKKTLKNRLKGVLLTHQISGEEIPSYIDALYRCEVIMFLDIEIKEIRQAESIATIFHKLIKPLCVIRFHDNIREVYSFAHKRVSVKDDNEVVLEQSVLTPSQPIKSSHEQEGLLSKELDFGNLVNSVNKRDLYIEAMVKAFIATHPALFSKITEFLNTSIWYNCKEILDLLEKLEMLKNLNQQKRKALLVKDKVLLNSHINSVLGELELKLESLV